jgi:hypothetical protein
MINFLVMTVWLSSCCSGCAASRSTKEHQNSTTTFGLDILTTQAAISNPKTALNLHCNSLQNSLFAFLFGVLLAEMIAPQNM